MSSSRENRAYKASIDKSRVFASGSNMHVYKGVYTHGERAELKVVDEARNIIESFNAEKILRNTMITLNIPSIWKYVTNAELSLVEPFIENFEKFNSNTGWTPRHLNTWMEVMQALSHYSYHSINGRLLLCDLQGGVYQNGFILTDPVIMSRAAGEYGPTDLGQLGIDTFFSRHKCNQYCRGRGWKSPINRRAHFPAQQGTSMEFVVPTRNTRAPLTRVPQQQRRQHYNNGTIYE